MTTLIPSAISFTGGPNVSKSVSSFTTKTMRHIRHPPPKNVTLSYPHKTYWCRLTNVLYGSFMGSDTNIHIQFTDSLETVRRQTMIWGLWAQARQNIYVCLPVCLWVWLFVYQKGILPLASDLYKLRHCLGLNITFSETSPSQKTIKNGQHKENMWWWLWTRLVTQVESTSVQCSKGFELEHKNWLHVCLSATSLLSSLLKTWLLSLITFLFC